jgi:hypothetical protein
LNHTELAQVTAKASCQEEDKIPSLALSLFILDYSAVLAEAFPRWFLSPYQSHLFTPGKIAQLVHNSQCFPDFWHTKAHSDQMLSGC